MLRTYLYIQSHTGVLPVSKGLDKMQAWFILAQHFSTIQKKVFSSLQHYNVIHNPTLYILNERFNHTTTRVAGDVSLHLYVCFACEDVECHVLSGTVLLRRRYEQTCTRSLKGRSYGKYLMKRSYEKILWEISYGKDLT